MRIGECENGRIGELENRRMANRETVKMEKSNWSLENGEVVETVINETVKRKEVIGH
jgi:hypothetical protein